MTTSPVPASPGARLRTAREAMGLTELEVAEQLRLTKNWIMAIENDEFHKGPRLAFVRGHLRNFARLVACSPDEILKAFECLGLEDHPRSVVLPVTTPPPPSLWSRLLGRELIVVKRTSWRRWVLWGLIASLLLGLALYSHFYGQALIERLVDEIPVRFQIPTLK